MVRVILEKLTVLASSKQSELAHLKITTDPAYQQHREDPTYTFLQRASKRKSVLRLMLPVWQRRNTKFSVTYLFPVLSGWLYKGSNQGYIQVGLNNERLVATEETVVILQLLDTLGSAPSETSENRCPKEQTLQNEQSL